MEENRSGKGAKEMKLFIIATDILFGLRMLTGASNHDLNGQGTLLYSVFILATFLYFIFQSYRSYRKNAIKEVWFYFVSIFAVLIGIPVSGLFLIGILNILPK